MKPGALLTDEAESGGRGSLYGSDGDLAGYALGPAMALEDLEYLSDVQSDGEFSSSSNSGCRPRPPTPAPPPASLTTSLCVPCAGGAFFQSPGSPDSGSCESDPEFFYPSISSEYAGNASRGCAGGGQTPDGHLWPPQRPSSRPRRRSPEGSVPGVVRLSWRASAAAACTAGPRRASTVRWVF